MQARKSPQEIFSDIYRNKSWDDYGATRPFFSGFGSHAQPTVDAYVQALKPVLERFPGARVTDLGCGDFNIGKQIRPLCGPYIACDVVPDLIEHNKREFAGLNVDFRCLDITSDELPAGDIAIVRQVLQHLNNSQIERFVKQIDGYKILIVTEHIPSGAFEPNLNKATGSGIRLHGIRPSGVVLHQAPFNLRYQHMMVLADAPDGKDLIRTTAYFI